MTENLEVSVSFYNENPISVELPNQVKCKVKEIIMMRTTNQHSESLIIYNISTTDKILTQISGAEPK